jgi:hypothetical protein
MGLASNEDFEHVETSHGSERKHDFQKNRQFQEQHEGEFMLFAGKRLP